MRTWQQTAATLCFLAWSGLTQAQSNYVFTPLGDQLSSTAFAINNLGQVVGVSYTGGIATQSGMLWENGQSHFLSPLDGTRMSFATDINDRGQIVGYSGNDPRGYDSKATLWYQGGVTDLHQPGQYNSFAYAINSDGKIVGSQGSIANIYDGVVLNRATSWDAVTGQNLGNYANIFTDHSYSLAYGINASGQVVGVSAQLRQGSYAELYTHATLWSGSVTDLGTLGGDYSSASAINDQGVIVGVSNAHQGGYQHATIWDGNGIHALGTLDEQATSRAISINNVGDVVGSIGPDGQGIETYAALWRGNTTINLNSFLDDASRDAGWVLDEAHDINDAGWIVGRAHNPLLGISNRAFLLSIPAVPEPNQAWLIGLGLGCLCMARKRVQPS